MARIMLSQLAASLSGRADGVTFRMTRHGPVMQASQDTPPRTDAASMAVKAHFLTGVLSWSVFRQDLQGTLKTLQAKDRRASPGPWITAFTNYIHVASWDYAYFTHPDKRLTILSVEDIGAWWRFWVDAFIGWPWDSVMALIFHPLSGIDPQGWQELFILSGPRVDVPHHDMPPGCSVLLLPFDRLNNTDIGPGDAHARP